MPDEPWAELSTRSFGTFRIRVHLATEGGGRDIVVCKGNLREGGPPLCRVTSACTLSTAFDASDCDCSGQLREAMRQINDEGRGVIIYLDQEGRGHGIDTKIRALRNKNAGLDTLEAVERLGLEADVTNYQDVPTYLRDLETQSVRLLTNNPDKARSLNNLGVEIDEIVSCFASSVHPDTLRHLAAKRDRGHMLPREW